ncbi:hypothetical protein AB0N09_33375 [Streptomyces erythrochromogenes]|uniref:hypothetical protein n=1 Tax=Streptomyces erythrochromogenes TaxID=285574 RepID=UPI00342216E9
MTEPYPEFSEGPFWPYGDYSLEAAWWVFEESLNEPPPASDAVPADSVNTGAFSCGVPTAEARVESALDTVWTHPDLGFGAWASPAAPEEVRPWLARAFLDSGIPETVNPSPPPPVLEALTDIVARSPQSADSRHLTGLDAPDTAWQRHAWPEPAQIQHPAPLPSQEHGQWTGQWRPDLHPHLAAAPCEQARPATESAPIIHEPSRLQAERDPRLAPFNVVQSRSQPKYGSRPDRIRVTDNQQRVLEAIARTHAPTFAEVVAVVEEDGVLYDSARISVLGLAGRLGIKSTDTDQIIGELHHLLTQGDPRLVPLTPAPPVTGRLTGTDKRHPSADSADPQRTKRRRTSDEHA